MTPVTTVVEHETAKRLLEQLFLHHPETHSSRDSVDSLLYRGVGDHRHGLVPTALRNDPASLERFVALTQHSRICIDHPVRQHFAEWFLIREYYRFANRNGLSLPRLPDAYHRHITLCDDLSFDDRRRPNLDDWPPDALEPILAIAQHYGLPTRLLDWTTDPLVALYFAAVNAMNRLASKGRDAPTHLAVWSTSIFHLDFANALNFDRRLRIVHPPRADNPNLTAQRGVFTLCRQKIDLPMRSQEIDRRPLDELVTKSLESASNAEKDSVGWRFGGFDYNSPFFYKHTLPLAEAPRLYALLQARGYDSGRLYPGFGGAAQSVMDDALMARLLPSK